MAGVYGYPGKSRKIPKSDSWFYIQREGLVIVANGNGIGTVCVTIPWRQVFAAIKWRIKLDGKP